MRYIYLSPHLDDAVFSCGGLIWEQTQNGHEVEIWTIFSADPPQGELSLLAKSLHQDWDLSDDPIQVRRNEDLNACQILGARPKYLPYLDCIYRKSPQGEFLYQSVEEIFGGLKPAELALIELLNHDLRNQLPLEAVVAAPLGIGNHVDHQATRKAVRELETPVYYYADYPYLREGDGLEILSLLESSEDWEKEIFLISEDGIEHWHLASLAYTSQVPIFWETGQSLLDEIRHIQGIYKGLALWKPVENK
jgi:LmbE family N-acetylglucosaminyl deacetylase